MELKEESKVNFSREELIEITKQTLGDLIAADPLLQDLPRDVTLEEVTSQLALQHGQSMTIYLHKDNGELLPIVVPVNANVRDLKIAIKHHVNLSLKRSGVLSRLSWHYVWKTNTLVSGSTKLDEDNEKLSDLGLSNKSKVSFMKKLRHKNAIRQKKRR